jgi:ABC-type lipoprotein export system ATPase subunit
VLRVFENLVDKGQTVLLVTHDRDVAARGTRVVEIQDGHLSEVTD